MSEVQLKNFEHIRASGSTGELFCFKNTVQIVQRGHFVSVIERSQFNENTPVKCPKAMNNLGLFASIIFDTIFCRYLVKSSVTKMLLEFDF